ncbi:hypothetical protein RDI58_001331 [Solanum bulbocastanum]|uniref:Uncharacterized protein n=1 Tax=Solanum bulbocastanum TaxID=147425 RepID=A0AAN8UDV6_SOLBU
MFSQLAANEILHMNVEPNDITDEQIKEQPPPPRAKSTRWDKEHNNKTFEKNKRKTETSA